MVTGGSPLPPVIPARTARHSAAFQYLSGSPCKRQRANSNMLGVYANGASIATGVDSLELATPPPTCER